MEVGGGGPQLGGQQAVDEGVQPALGLGLQAGDLAQQREAFLHVLDTLAGDVADLQGGERRAHLLVDRPRQAADVGGRLGHLGMVGDKVLGAGDQAVRHGGQQAVAMVGEGLCGGAGGLQLQAEGLEVGIEGAQLGAAQLDAVADLLGEQAKLGPGRGDPGGGDLDVDGEDPEIGQVAPHLGDAGGQVVAEAGHPRHGVAARGVAIGQGQQAGGGGLQFGGGGRDGPGVQGLGQVFQGGDQPADPVHRLGQDLAGLKEPALHGQPRGVQAAVDRGVRIAVRDRQGSRQNHRERQ